MDDAPHERSAWRAVAVPNEHGGWGLTIEPGVAGLIVAPSTAGGALAGAALVAFLARTPLRIVLVDLYRRRGIDRTRRAAIVLVAELAVLSCLVGVAITTAAGGHWWWPLAVAAPLITIEAAYDARSRSRRLVPELAGAMAMGSVAAMIVEVDGGSATVAGALWVVLIARSVASIPFVRFQITRSRRRAVPAWTSNAAQAVAVMVAAAALALADAAVAGALAVVALAGFHLWAVRRPAPEVAVIGAQEVVAGLTVAVVAALGLLAP